MQALALLLRLSVLASPIAWGWALLAKPPLGRNLSARGNPGSSLPSHCHGEPGQRPPGARGLADHPAHGDHQRHPPGTAIRAAAPPAGGPPAPAPITAKVGRVRRGEGG